LTLLTAHKSGIRPAGAENRRRVKSSFVGVTWESSQEEMRRTTLGLEVDFAKQKKTGWGAEALQRSKEGNEKKRERTAEKHLEEGCALTKPHCWH